MRYRELLVYDVLRDRYTMVSQGDRHIANALVGPRFYRLPYFVYNPRVGALGPWTAFDHHNAPV
jgi:hypothetical protein